MIREVVLVRNKLGLHARAAARLVGLTSKFSSEIHISREGRSEAIDCKSILGILMLAASQGTRLVLSINGRDEVEASRTVQAFFDAGFGEEN